MSDKSKSKGAKGATLPTGQKQLRQGVAQWTLSVVQVKEPLVIIFFVESWIGTREAHDAGSRYFLCG